MSSFLQSNLRFKAKFFICLVNSNQMKRVVITGIGAITPFGIGRKLLFNELLANKCSLKYDNVLKTIVGRIPEGQQPGELDSSKWKSGDLRETGRGGLLALLATEEAFNDAGLSGYDLTETGVNVGMGIADLELISESANLIRDGKPRRVSPFFVPRILTNTPAGHISIRYGLRGPVLSSSTACATGLHAVGDAATFIAMGRAERMVAGAVETCVNQIALTGFKRLRALSSTQSRPFDSERDGFVLSEGCAILVLESLESAKERNAQVYAEIKGYGVSGDAYHLTSPTEDGVGAFLSMSRCVHDAKLDVSDIGYVNAHATSTPVGDRSEARAIARLFPNVTVSSIKGHIGHTLAAAGAIEIAVTAMCLKNRYIIGNANLKKTDITEKIKLPDSRLEWSNPTNALVNSFGFGGPHATLCLSLVSSNN